ncbi:MAG: phosphoglucomutase/phosphomannomutase family protein [Haloarculaceae archaeon]
MDDADAIEFGTDGWRATLDTFTKPRVRLVGQAVADYLDAEGGPGAVAVGYDARDHSRGFAEELARVLAANGRDVLVPERDVPTPVVAWTVVDRGLAGALMVTASHNPPEYNGVKFVPADGAPALPTVTDGLESRLAPPDPAPEAEWGAVTETDLREPYLEHALSFADADLSGLRVAYDAMHGSGRGVTDELLERAGADVTRLRCDRDPQFGGGLPKPEADRVPALIERVRSGDADLGVVNDGDADRVSVVTPERGFLDANRFFAALYDALLEREGGDAVRTVSTSSLVDRVAAAHDQSVHETAVGFKWVGRAMAEHDALMGGEESGGFGVRGHVRTKDGVLVGLLAARAAAERPLDERVDALVAEHGDVVQRRVSLDCPDDRKAPVLAALEEHIPDAVAGEPVADVTTVDGFKLALADGTWLLVRPSGTEPKLRVYAEAGNASRVDALLEAGRDLIEPLI